MRIYFNMLGPDELLINFVSFMFRVDDFTGDVCCFNEDG